MTKSQTIRRFPNPCGARPTSSLLYLIVFAVVASLGHVAVSCWLTREDAPGLALDATNTAFWLPGTLSGSEAGGDKEASLTATSSRQAHPINIRSTIRSLGLKQKNTTSFDTTTQKHHPKPPPPIHELNNTSGFQTPPPPGADRAEPVEIQPPNPNNGPRLEPDKSHATSVHTIVETSAEGHDDSSSATEESHQPRQEVNNTTSIQASSVPLSSSEGDYIVLPVEIQQPHSNPPLLGPDENHTPSINTDVQTSSESPGDASLQAEHSQQQQAYPSNPGLENSEVANTISIQETGLPPLSFEFENNQALPAQSQQQHQDPMERDENPTPSNHGASIMEDRIATLLRQQQFNTPGLVTEPEENYNGTNSSSSNSSSTTPPPSPTTIVVVVEGELGNFLSHICYAMGLQLWLRDRHGLNNTELLLLPSVDPQKYPNTRQDLLRCFPRLRDKIQHLLPEDVYSLDPIHQKFRERVELQNTWLDNVLPRGAQDRVQLYDRMSQQEGNGILTTNDELMYYVNSTDIIDHSLDAFMEMMQLYNQTLPGFQVPRSETSHISLPFLFSRNLQFFVMMDKYYDELMPFFEFDNARCCAEAPDPSETVFHFRDFQTEMGFFSYSTELKYGGREELPPNRVANELLAHLPSNTSKVAMTSRFSHQPASRSYVDALQNTRGIQTRVITGQTAVQDFCFLQQAEQELVGITYSTFVQWAAVLGKAKVAQLYSYDTVLTERKFRPGINAKRACYNWTNPTLAAKIKFPNFISEELVEFKRRQREGDNITLDEYQDIIATEALRRAEALRPRRRRRRKVDAGVREEPPDSPIESQQRGETASIVVHLDGGLGNFLSSIAFAMGVKLRLRDRYPLDTTQLVLFPNPDNSKYLEVRENLLSCFPRIHETFGNQLPAELELLKNMKAEHDSVSLQQETWMDNFLPGGRAQRKDLQRRMRKLDGRIVVTGQHLDLIDDGLTAFTRVMRMQKLRSAGAALRELRQAGDISIPFLNSRSLQFSVMINKYYEELIPFFEFNRSQCCSQVPDPNESVLDLRNCRAVPGPEWNTTQPDGICQELSPHRVAYELFGHLSNTSGTDKVAIASRFPDHPETQSYVQALQEERGIPTRVVSSRATIQEFCFLQSAQKELAGMAASVYVKWAALMGNATSNRLYVYHTPFTEEFFGGAKSELIAYNWTNPALAAKITYQHFASHELEESRRVENTTVETQRSLENTTIETKRSLENTTVETQ